MKLKVSDRVAVYAEAYGVELLSFRGSRGTIRALDEEKCYVDFDKESERPEINHGVYTKQCRRLVKKPRRRIWLEEEYLGQMTIFGGTTISAAIKPFEGGIEFVEVRKKK